ncbi:MAG: S1 family peptidase, partial [Polyangiaceae bacterium]
MLRRSTSARPGILALIFAAFFATSAFAQPLPSLPGVTYSGSPGPSTQTPTASPASAASDPRRGIVTLQRDGHTVGIGTVLGGDGRILTEFAAVSASDKVDVRYADGHVVHGKAMYRDKDWDLALVVPLSGKWTEGLAASEADPGAGELRVFVAGGNGTTISTAAHLHARVQAHTKEGAQLPNALELDLKTPPTPGAAIIDASGNVVGVYVHLCRPGAPQLVGAPPPASPPPCSAMFYGAPVSALRSFIT